MSRQDMIGGVCAAIAMCLIAWLALDSLDRAECRNLVAELTLPLDPSATYAPNVQRCLRKVGASSGDKSATEDVTQQQPTLDGAASEA